MFPQVERTYFKYVRNLKPSLSYLPLDPPPQKKNEGLNPPKKDMGEKKNVKMKEKW